ncbi:MAG: hypothetical protein ABI939_04075 [Anaerolineaceae bacterium]
MREKDAIRAGLRDALRAHDVKHAVAMTRYPDGPTRYLRRIQLIDAGEPVIVKAYEVAALIDDMKTAQAILRCGAETFVIQPDGDYAPAPPADRKGKNHAS